LFVTILTFCEYSFLPVDLSLLSKIFTPIFQIIAGSYLVLQLVFADYLQVSVNVEYKLRTIA
jgi:hypothetical protein